MSRDILERLEMFARLPVGFVRVALNMDQVQEYNPPPNPAKMIDTRFKQYRVEYGTEFWELDALRPQTLIEFVKSTVLRFRDEKLWEESVKKEEYYRKGLREMAKKNWKR